MGDTRWVDARELTVEGKGWEDTASFYDRLPARAQGVVRDPVWDLSHHSAGLCVRFVTDAPSIAVRWTLISDNLAMTHMPATGVSGVDLYARTLTVDEAATLGPGQWRWLGIGQPQRGGTNEAVLASGLPAVRREYLLYLPLYNGVQAVAIGVPASAALEPGLPRPADRAKPVVVWGTSIVQGGCASRPGMAYPAILGRYLDRPMINLGFSGNGQLEIEVARLLAELDAAAYVLDCLPNLGPEAVAQRTGPVVETLRAAHPDTPIILVENITYQGSWIYPEADRGHTAKNVALRQVYTQLQAAGVPHLYYVSGDSLLGEDMEGTVDGTHATDLGFLRMAQALEPVIRQCLVGG